MLEPVRRFASSRIRPLGDRAWRRVRGPDPHRERARLARELERELEARVTRRIERRLRRQQRRESEQTLLRTSRGLGLRRPLRLLLDEVDRLLAAKPKAKLALIVDGRSAVLPALIGARYPRVRITEIGSDVDESARHVALAAAGRFDLIVDAVVHREDPTGLLLSLLYHLRRNGYLGIADFRVATEGAGALWPVLARALSRQSEPGVTVRTGVVDAAQLPAGLGADAPLSPEHAEALARSIGRVVVGAGYLLVQNRTVALATLREHEMAPLLESSRSRFGAVLSHTDAIRFAPRNVVTDHRAESAVREQREIAVPALELRSYHDLLCAPPQIVAKDHLLLVETYRHHLYERMVNRLVTEVAPRFGTIRRDVTRPITLSGAYFHWDSEWPGHFGHVLTEQVSRLWGLEAALERHPDLKILLGRRPRETRAMPFERAVLAAVGIDEDRIQLYDRPARVDRLLAATPMFSMPEYVSPAIEETWDRVGDAALAEASGRPTPKRFFCGRERANRACHNAPEVEALFREYGFEIVYPERLSFADQIAMFRDAEVVAGYAGSALFTLMFCAEVKAVVMLAPESYTANNEYLIGAVRGHAFDVFWSVPDSASLVSSFTFDLDREGRLLRAHLGSLG